LKKIRSVISQKNGIDWSGATQNIYWVAEKNKNIKQASVNQQQTVKQSNPILAIATKACSRVHRTQNNPHFPIHCIIHLHS